MARGVATLVACRYDKCWSGLCNMRIHCECLWWLGGLVSLSTCVFAWAPCLLPLRGRGEKKFSRRRRPCWHSCCIVVFSLHLEFSGWGRRKGKWLAAFQETWASALWKEKKDRQTDHIGYSCCVAPREPQPPMLPGVPHLTWADSELVCEDTITECFRAPLGNVYLCCLSNQMELPSNHQHQVKVWALSAFSIHYFCPFQAQPNPLRSTTELHSPWQLQPRQPRAERHQGALPWRRGRWQASLRSAGQAVLQVVLQ